MKTNQNHHKLIKTHKQWKFGAALGAARPRGELDPSMNWHASPSLADPVYLSFYQIIGN